MLTIYSALDWTAAIVIVSFAAILFFMDEHRSSRALAFTSVMMAFWCASIGGFYAAGDPESALLFIRLGHAFGSLIVLGVCYFLMSTHRKELRNPKLFYMLCLVEVVLLPLYFFSDFFTKEVIFTGDGPLDRVIIDAPTLFLHYLYASIVVSLGFRELLVRQYEAKDGHERDHGRNVIFVVGSTLSLIMATLLVTRVLGFGYYFWIAPLVMVAWVPLSVHSLIQYHVVPRRLFVAQVSVLAMSMIVFADIFVPDGFIGIAGRLVVAIFFAVTSFFLVKILANNVHQESRLAHAAKELHALNATLKTANERLTVLDLQRSKFISIASHQLRAPLTAINGYSSMMLEGSFGKLPKKAVSALEKIYRSGTILMGTITDFLDTSTLEGGTMHFAKAPLELVSFVEEVIAQVAPNVRFAGLEFHFEHDQVATLWVQADRDKLRHVLVNLIDNSIHYTPSGAITVQLSAQNAQAKLSVSDTGIGMSQETIAKLFGKFARGKEAESRSAEGVGLGLYLAKEIVTAHGGTLVAQSDGPGNGSRFEVTLPIASKETFESK